MVMANSPWIPSTVLRSATINPVRYSAKWRRWRSLEKMSAYSAIASCTIVGNATIPGMSECSHIHVRQTKIGQNPIRLAYFYRLEREIAKPQF